MYALVSQKYKVPHFRAFMYYLFLHIFPHLSTSFLAHIVDKQNIQLYWSAGLRK